MRTTFLLNLSILFTSALARDGLSKIGLEVSKRISDLNIYTDPWADTKTALTRDELAKVNKLFEVDPKYEDLTKSGSCDSIINKWYYIQHLIKLITGKDPQLFNTIDALSSIKLNKCVLHYSDASPISAEYENKNVSPETIKWSNKVTHSVANNFKVTLGIDIADIFTKLGFEYGYTVTDTTKDATEETRLVCPGARSILERSALVLTCHTTLLKTTFIPTKRPDGNVCYWNAQPIQPVQPVLTNQPITFAITNNGKPQGKILLNNLVKPYC
ncbi:hypothetical protein K502DRAFT_60462 [Neoconidiobolus thromboides FSU 785]|nr:hypothetical protein K502DRAFT_60462 [Neoconidiobolus thromboides FSU 785]